MTYRILSSAALTVLLLSSSGCGQVTGDPAPLGELGVVHQAPDGTKLTDRDATFDFGAVFADQSVTQKVVVRNLGAGSLRVVSLELEHTDGDAAPFSFQFQPVTLNSSEVVEYSVTFTAPPTDAPVSYAATFVLHAENARQGEDTARLTFTARALPTDCQVPSELDLGLTVTGDVNEGSLTLRNDSPLPVTASISGINSSNDDAAAFSLAELLPGELTLEPNSTREVKFAFHPTEAKSYLAFVRVRASELCSEQVVTLTGSAVDYPLSWSPTKVEWGSVRPGVEATRQLVFTNVGSKPLELTDLATSLPDELYVVADAGMDKTKLVVPSHGTAELTLACKPSGEGPRKGTLNFNTALERTPSLKISLFCTGGGPDVDVSPTSNLDFGKVAWFASATPPAFAARRVALTNKGTEEVFFGSNDGAGDFAPPYVEIVPLNADTTADEFTVKLPPSYDPAKGIAPGARADLRVTFTPSSVGKKEAQLTLHTNDPVDPSIVLHLSAEAVVMPPCQYSLTRTSLDFGRMTPPDDRELGFSIRNDGTSPTDVCLVSGVDVGPDSDAAYSLPNGPLESYELAPGEQKEIRVRAWAQGTNPTSVSTLAGEADLYVSSPTQPEAKVSLTTELGPSCLVVSPDELDFGSVQNGFSAANRTFHIYNVCQSAVSVTGLSTQAGGSNEFSLTQAPGSTQLNPGTTPLSFQAKYQPTDLGDDTSAVTIDATEGGVNVTYVVPLHGRGSTQSAQSDVFDLPATPKADVLFVMDVHGACLWQQQVAANVSSFMDYAWSAGVDFQLGATTSDMDVGGEQGRLTYGPVHPDRILTPATTNFDDAFKAMVQPGCIGSGWTEDAEAALTALTPPRVNEENAGFLRPEASLGIVVITYNGEDSPRPLSYYVDRFWNLKGWNRTGELSVSYTADPTDDANIAQFPAALHGVLAEDPWTPGWDVTLKELGRVAFGQPSRFYLSKEPDVGQGAVEVRIDGGLVASTNGSGATVWTFDPVANAITFSPAFLPQAGQRVAISYAIAAYP